MMLFVRIQVEKKPSDEKWGRGYRPVVNITWLDATQFCNYKSSLEGLPHAYDKEGRLVYDKDGKKQYIDTGKRIDLELLKLVNGYRLPTDIEWEYAAKGGMQSLHFKFIGSNKVNEVAWYKDNSRFSTAEVGKKLPNELKLYDMAGNVYEYCTDGPGTFRILRGGGWSSHNDSMRPSYKNGCKIDEYHSYIGFRLARKM
eukprot:TRINITY_DN1689_c0_g2_i2.p1 TRINITY_DN1689_c0_g2~~TRINITY_DN1689_c0_g2_i2.p1  ORF type:complete len:199 (-),score=14.82 TRINITY_DN1689_c0_g2_i2:54-650(-)